VFFYTPWRGNQPQHPLGNVLPKNPLLTLLVTFENRRQDTKKPSAIADGGFCYLYLPVAVGSRGAI